MPKMSIVVPHQLSQDEAMARIKNLLGEVKADYGDKVTDLRESWSGHRGEFAFKAMGFAVSGSLDVKPGEISLNGSLPLAATPFKSKIESTIRTRATQLLAP